MSGTTASKADQSVQESRKSKINSCQWDKLHQHVLHRRKKNPGVICLVNFPDSGEICSCYSKLVLRSSDINGKNFSKQLCTLLGMDNCYLFIEGDGLSKKGASRLSSLLSDALELFDSRLTIVMFCEKSLPDGAVKKMVEKEIDAASPSDNHGDYFHIPTGKKLKTQNLENKSSQLEEEEKNHLKSVCDNTSEKDLLILKLKEELLIEKKKFNDKEALNKAEKEELEKLAEAAGVEAKANQNLQHKLKAAEDKLKAAEDVIEELSNSKEEWKVLANEHLKERNFRLKEAESNEQVISNLKEVVNELELKVSEVDTKAGIIKHLEDSLKEKEVVIDHLKIQIEESQGQLIISKNVLNKGSQTEVESKKPAGKNDDINSVKNVQEEMLKNQRLFPMAGASEIIRRSLKSFCCLENFVVLESGLFECTVNVVKGSVSGIEQLSPFKGAGKSKKRAKVDAFESYLSSILKCI